VPVRHVLLAGGEEPLVVGVVGRIAAELAEELAEETGDESDVRA